MNAETCPSPSNFEFDKRLIVLTEIPLRVFRRLKGLSHTKIQRGAMGWLKQFNEMTPHGKACHLTLLLAPILLTWEKFPLSTIGVTPNKKSQLDLSPFGIGNPSRFCLTTISGLGLPVVSRSTDEGF
jgi:hypothetical protein